MFRASYQGGAVFEIFSGQGKDPVAKWKLYGGPSAVYKEYNKEIKGFVYCLEGSSQTVKMQMPEHEKMSLGLIQRFLVLQLNIPQCHDFSTELVITDAEHLKRRLHISTVHKELSVTHLHAKIPFIGLKRCTWSTLCIDLVSLTDELFKGFSTLDRVTLFATCKVRRIFTMKTKPTALSDDEVFLPGAGMMDIIPDSFQYPPNVSQITQVLNIKVLRKAEMVTDAESDGQKKPSSEECILPSRHHESRQQSLTQTEKSEHLAADESGAGSDTESPGVAPPTPAEFRLCSYQRGLSSDLQIWNSRESNEGSEPQLTLKEEVFISSSQPHSPNKGHDQGNQGQMDKGDQIQDKRGRQYRAQPEDDFFGSEIESDEEEEDETLKTDDSSPNVLQLDGTLRMQDDDGEELQMLASLKREQDEDKCIAPGLSASQIHQCGVSVSLSSDDASAWTCTYPPVNQGYHYQKEMNSLLQSNPREWMDVLSPPIMPPSHQRRSGNTRNNLESVVRGEDRQVKEEENEDEYLNLLYDPCLNCYFDPKTGKYYELTGLRIHPGIIASVIFVSVAAVAAAVLILRKCCFPVNEATYRYSLLRRNEDQQSDVTEEDGDRRPCAVGEESDEDLLD
ncbi:protein CFAP20DC [Xenentodon cancila]